MVFGGLLLVLRIPAVSNDGSSGRSTNDSSSTELTVQDVYRELTRVSAEWERLGFLLKVPQHRLDAIKRDYRFVDDCYRIMLHAWYDANVHPSWDIVAWALDQMGQNGIAESIRKKYTLESELQKHPSCAQVDSNIEFNFPGNYAQQMEEMEHRYVGLAYEVMTSMKKKNVNLEEVKFWLTQIPVNLIYTHKHFLEGKHIQVISRAESLLEIFGHLRSYWNFLDYGLLEYVAITFGHDEVKQSMRRYKEELTSFRKSVTLSQFMKLWPNRMNPTPEFSKLVIKLNRIQSFLTLQDVEEIRLSFARNYSFVTFALMYGAFENGSVVLTWFIPSSIAPQLVQDLKNGGSGFLKEHNITEVSIDGHTVAIVESNGKIWNLHPSITTPMHFWRTRYAYFLEPGEDITVSCSKTCAKASPPIWYHTLSKDPWLPMPQIAIGPELELSLRQPPVTTDVGYFCCACIGDDPKVDANCFGVAYMPQVTNFTVTRKGNTVSSVHVSDHIMVGCEVYGFPSLVDITGPSELSQYVEVIPTWYSKMQYIEISHATINHSGLYTCAALLHASPDLYLITEHVKRSVVVYAPPTITSLRELTQNEQRMFNYPLDSDVISCDVTSSVFFNVTWLFNGKVTNYISSKCSVDHKSDNDKFTCALEVARTLQKGTYECIVNTAFETRETSKTIRILNSGSIDAKIVAAISILAIATVIFLQHQLHKLMQCRKSDIMTNKTLHLTKLSAYHEALQTTALPMTMEALQTTGSSTTKVTLQTTELPMTEEALQTTESITTKDTLQTTELPMTEEALQTTELPMTEEALQTTELPMTKEAISKHQLSVQLHHTFPEPIVPIPEITIGEVHYLTGIAVNNKGEIVVAEQNCISIFTCSGKKIGFIISELDKPHGIAFDRAGNILVTDLGSHSIKKFTPEGKFLTAVGKKGSKELEFNCPTGIRINHCNKRVYVCDRHNHRLQVLNEDLTFSSTFGSRGGGDKEFNYPRDVAFDSTGSVYITDSWNNRIQVFTPAGSFLKEFGKKGSGEGKHYPFSVSIDSNDMVYVTEMLDHCVSIFTSQGEFIQSFGTKGAGPGEFNKPDGIAVDKNGLLYVSDTNNKRVQVFKIDLSLPTTGYSAIQTTVYPSKSEGLTTTKNALKTTGYPPLRKLLSYQEPTKSYRQSLTKEALQTTGCRKLRRLESFPGPRKQYKRPMTEEALLTTEFPTTEGVSKHQLSVQLHHIFPEPIVPIPEITIGEVHHPTGIAVNNKGEIVVAEQNCISIFTCSGKKIGSIISELDKPHGIAFDRAGNILVTDLGSHSIKKFTPEGKFLTAIGKKGSKILEFKYPAGIRVNYTNKKVYVSDQRNRRIQILNEDLTFSSCFGSQGSGDGQFNFPSDIGFDCTGNVYIADSKNHCIQVFTPEGGFMKKFGKKGSGEGGLNCPSSICIDSDNMVYVTEKDNNRVSIFTCQGKFIHTFGTRGQFNEPSGIAVDTSGKIYVSDTWNNQVQCFKKLV